MSVSLSDFVKEKVYPQIDAVEAGLLNNLHPATISSNGAYKLDCPKCGKKEGFYYPTRAYVQCNRKIECGEGTSIWDVLASNGMKNRDILTLLCEKARVELPDSRVQNDSATGADQRPPVMTPGKAIVHVTQRLASQNPKLLTEFQAARGYSDEVMKVMRLGVYTTAEEVLKLLVAQGITKETAAEKGYIGFDQNDPSRIWSGMAGRVVGYWPHPDGDVRLWGRLPSGKGDKQNPKYRFADGLKKDIPYLFAQRQSTVLVAVEGTIDAWALQLEKQWGVGIGQASINTAQAAYFVSKGVDEAAHFIDGDNAGYEGALSSIRACETVGITLSIIALGAGLDDPDSMRRSGKGDELRSMIANRMNSGEFLARFCVARLSESPPDLRGVARIRSIARCLTPPSARRWEDMSKSLGIHVEPKEEAVRLLAGYIEAGLSIEDGLYQVQRRTGLNIRFDEAPSHG